MVGILVGNRFEEIIHTRYPWLKRMKNGNNAADFRVELFDLELKAGLAESGVEPHKYQLEQLTQNRRVAYVCGFHFEKGLQASYELDKIGAVRRISQLEFPLRYVVSQDVIQAMYGAHVLVSEEKKHPYCKLGPSLFDNIILGRQVKRHGVWHSPFELYAISPFDYMLRPAAKGDVEKPGLILHRKLDEKIIDFFASI